MTTILLAAVVVTGAALYLRRGIARSERTIAADHGARVASLAASWLSTVLGRPAPEVEQLLKARRAGQTVPELAPLRVVEYRLVKRGPNDVLLQVTVAWDTGTGTGTGTGTLSIGRIEESIAWQDVPGDARAEMIRSGERELAYAWIEAPPKAQA